MTNLILNADSYKASHYRQYPSGTTRVSSYIEPRGGDYANVLFFGLQAFIKQYLTQQITSADVAAADALLSAHGVPFNRDGWQVIVDDYSGYLPVEIQALPEGSVVPVRNALVQVVNTDDRLPWLTSYLETAILRAVWYPSTVATTSWECKRIIRSYLAETADNVDGLPFKLHDFGSRGATSAESAALGGLAHLVNFQGTDTLGAIVAGNQYYNEPMAGFSIPAAEHSTITSWGKDGERDAYANMLKQFAAPGKTVAVVSDSYDLWNAIDNIWGDDLKAQIENSGGTLVIRPDSGDPAEIVLKTVEKLMAKFGSRTNSKGCRMLPDCVRVIQGDGINLNSLEQILSNLKAAGISADNLAFGMGGALLQACDRDTMRWAMKASAAEVNGQWRDVFKQPITDPGKASKKGRLAVVAGADGWQTIREDELADRSNQLRTVYRNGTLLVDEDLATIRQRTE